MCFLPAFGFISAIIGTVLRAIMTPILELITFLFSTVFPPMLDALLFPLIEFFFYIFFAQMASIFLLILIALLSILQAIQNAFEIFAGIGTVYYRGESTTLLEMFLIDNTTLSRAFWMLTILCLALTLIFAIYAAARSALDFDFENKRPIGKVLGSLGRACLSFLLIPFFVTFSITMMTLVMQQVYNITQPEGGVSIADVVFQTAAMNANRFSSHNLSHTETFTTGIRASFNNGGWSNMFRVQLYFNPARVDYIIGYGLAIFMIIIMAGIAFMFIQRLFEIMLLYVSAPFFVSTMIFDDGAKFGAWRSAFIGKCVSGMGTLVLVNLYLTVVPIVMSPAVRFDPRSTSADFLTYDYLLKIIFVAAGALACKKGGAIITTLVDQAAGMQEEQAMQAGTSMATGAVIGTVALAKTAAMTVGKAVATGGASLGQDVAKLAQKGASQAFSSASSMATQVGQSAQGGGYALSKPSDDGAFGGGPGLAGGELGTGGLPAGDDATATEGEAVEDSVMFGEALSDLSPADIDKEADPAMDSAFQTPKEEPLSPPPEKEAEAEAEAEEKPFDVMAHRDKMIEDQMKRTGQSRAEVTRQMLYGPHGRLARNKNMHAPQNKPPDTAEDKKLYERLEAEVQAENTPKIDHKKEASERMSRVVQARTGPEQASTNYRALKQSSMETKRASDKTRKEFKQYQSARKSSDIAKFKASYQKASGERAQSLGRLQDITAGTTALSKLEDEMKRPKRFK